MKPHFFVWFGPVPMTPVPSQFDLFTPHDNHSHLVLPYHAPEVVHGVRHRSLCCDVSFFTEHILNVVRIDVVVT